MKTTLIRGVPRALQQDGWWLNDRQGAEAAITLSQTGGIPGFWQGQGSDSNTRRTIRFDGSRKNPLVPLILLGALILLGDVLVWGMTPGLSLAALSGVIVACAVFGAGARLSPRRLVWIMGGTILTVLPMVELVQPLSLLMGILGLATVLALVAGVPLSLLPRAAMRFWPLGIRQFGRDSGVGLSQLRSIRTEGAARLILLHWAMPLVFGAVFAVLLLEGNPILLRLVEGLKINAQFPSLARMVFWGGLVLMIWPALRAGTMAERLRAGPKSRPLVQGPKQLGLVNHASIARALILFNMMFVVQTMLDITVLYGGAVLPEGMTLAQYAHRGAYPLLVTALLAGGFALMSHAWVRGSKLLRLLLVLFVAQNVILVVSSIVRLDLYVEVYGLTRMRMAAAIWMALVAMGLTLVLVQVWKARSNGWLVQRSAGLGLGVLYLCCFVSFDAVIARYNTQHPVQMDVQYLCTLGDAAIPILIRADVPCGNAQSIETPADWREWGFRNQRARHSLTTLLNRATSEVPL